MAAFETLINGMYVTMYNRTADSVGFNWASGVAGLPNPTDARNTVASTLSAQNIAQVFRSTQPTYFNAQYGSISTTDAILKLYQNLDAKSLCKVIQTCDVALVPASSVAVECLAVGLRLITGYYVENQKGIYEGLLQKNAF